MRRVRSAFAAAALVLVAALPAAAQEAAPAVSPAPPGTLVASQLIVPVGAAGRWRAISSKKVVGSGSGTTFYQWYLSIYSLEHGAYRLRYRSPADGGPLETVAQAHGAALWFPVEQLAIVGSAQLMGGGVAQLVVQSHAMAADCGAGTITIFTSDARGGVVPAVSLQNGCELSATIAHGPSGDSLLLRGSYYAPSAAMCCPTKAQATATLRYRDGKWVETPNYYQLFVGKMPPG